MVTVFALFVVLLLAGFAGPIFVATVCLVYVAIEAFWWLTALPWRLMRRLACAAWRHGASAPRPPA